MIGLHVNDKPTGGAGEAERAENRGIAAFGSRGVGFDREGSQIKARLES